MDWFLFGTAALARPHFFPLVAVVALALRLPVLGVRRLRDAGRSGGLMLALFVPIIGLLVLVRWWCARSMVKAVPAEAALIHEGSIAPRDKRTGSKP